MHKQTAPMSSPRVGCRRQPGRGSSRASSCHQIALDNRARTIGPGQRISSLDLLLGKRNGRAGLEQPLAAQKAGRRCAAARSCRRAAGQCQPFGHAVFEDAADSTIARVRREADHHCPRTSTSTFAQQACRLVRWRHLLSVARTPAMPTISPLLTARLAWRSGAPMTGRRHAVDSTTAFKGPAASAARSHGRASAAPSRRRSYWPGRSATSPATTPRRSTTQRCVSAHLVLCEMKA